MTQAYYTGLTGIQSTQTAIDVTSDNIANVSTTGFRGNNVEFSSLFEDAMNTVDKSSMNNTVGKGAVVSSTQMIQTQGAIQQTQTNTDLAINGDGWFGVQDANNNTLYTRAGDFSFDKNSDLVTPDGMYVVGTMAGNIDGTTLTNSVTTTQLGTTSTQEKLSFPNTLVYPSIPTQNSSFKGSLDVEDGVSNTFVTSVIDSQNNQNDLTLKFTKSDPQVLPGMQWDIVATTTSEDGLTTYDTKNAKASFDEKGGLIANDLTTIDNNGSPITINLGTKFDGIISNSSPNPVISESDGMRAGDLVGYDINSNAEVIASFTNGQQSSVGKIALFHFQNDQGLERVSNSKFSTSSNSGDAMFMQDANGKDILGTDILSSALESSNVDLNKSLTELIVFQRSFDSNSKVMSTADDMMQKALDMDA